MFGHNMATFGFPDANELAIIYWSVTIILFSGKNGKQAVKILFCFVLRQKIVCQTTRQKKMKKFGLKKSATKINGAKEQSLERQRLRKKSAW